MDHSQAAVSDGNGLHLNYLDVSGGLVPLITRDMLIGSNPSAGAWGGGNQPDNSKGFR